MTWRCIKNRGPDKINQRIPRANPSHNPQTEARDDYIQIQGI